MQFPDWNLFAKLCGARSLGSHIYPKQNRDPRDEDYNEVVHKDLVKFVAGKNVSRKSINRLLETYFVHAEERGLDIDGETAASIWRQLDNIFGVGDEFILLSDHRKKLSDALPDALPPRTRDAFISFMSLGKPIEDGPNALRAKLAKIDDPVWKPLYGELSKRLEGANEVSRDVIDILQINCWLSLAFCFWLELIERDKPDPSEQARVLAKSSELFFATEDGQPNPRKAVARLLEHALEQSEFKTKSAFIETAFGSSEARAREAHRFFAGTDIPTFEKTRDAYRASHLGDKENPQYDDLPILIAQYVARSFRHLKEKLDTPLDDHLTPHFIIFELTNRQLQARTVGEPATSTSADHSIKNEQELS